MDLSPREEIAAASLLASHDVLENLTRSKSAMESLVREMNDLTCLLSKSGRLIWGNSVTARWLDVRGEGLHRFEFKKIFSESEWNVFAGELGRVGEENPSCEFHQTLMLSGDQREILWTLRLFDAVSNRRGEIVLAVGKDITDVLNARTDRAKLETELETAKILQQAFFPPSSIMNADLNIASFYRSADKCSGDWWGYFRLSPDLDLLCIADVTGHGVGSALVTAMTQASCVSFVQRHLNSEEAVSPTHLLHEINNVIHFTLKGDSFVTLVAFVFDYKRGEVRVSNAGHTFPLMLRPGLKEPMAEALVVGGNPLGYADDSVFKEIKHKLVKGSKYVLYTDGIIECTNTEDDPYGAGAFRRAIVDNYQQKASDLNDALVAEAFSFFGSHPLADDITLVVIETVREL